MRSNSEHKEIKTETPVEGLSNGTAMDMAKEKRLVAKLDLFLTPVLFVVFLSCFIDRVNIGKSAAPSLPARTIPINHDVHRKCKGGWHA